MTTESHQHSFSSSEWPFSDPDNAGVFTSSRVLYDKHPILIVSRDDDGDWQFLHGAVTEGDKCLLVCLGCIFERDRSVGQVVDLPPGWQAMRATANDEWERHPPEPKQER